MGTEKEHAPMESRAMRHVHTFIQLANNNFNKPTCGSPCHLVLSTRRVLATVLTILLQCFLSAVTSLSSASFIPVTSCVSSIHFLLGRPLLLLPSPFQLKCPLPFHLVSLSPIIVNSSRFISLCIMFILPLCILRTFHVPIFIFCLQLRLSRCTLMRSASKHPFGFSLAASLDPAAPDSLSRSFPVAVESHSGLGVSPFATIVFSFLVRTVFLAH